jgi:hypothetical protein
MSTRYQRGNQKQSIEEEQTTLWLQYTCLSFFDWRLLITPLVSCSHIVVCPSSIDGFWLPLWYLVVILLSVLLITPSVLCSHIVVCPSSIDGLWLPLWYIVVIVLSVLLRLTASDYPFGILYSYCFLSFFDWWLLITPLVSCSHSVICPSDYPFGIV